MKSLVVMSNGRTLVEKQSRLMLDAVSRCHCVCAIRVSHALTT